MRGKMQTRTKNNGNWKGYGLDLSGPRVMGIVNVTPDSFSDGGKYNTLEQAVKHAQSLEKEGVDIIDVGGESSRPGAEPVPEHEEMQRVIPVIQEIRKYSHIPISIDTCKANVADNALEIGANWINDISGLRLDPNMVYVAAKWNCPVVVMHMKGTPKTMQENPCYENVIKEITDYFEERISVLHQHDIKKIILDPGIGFGKRLNDNLKILKELDKFKKAGYPLLIGASRKSFIGEITGRNIDRRVAGSITSVIWAILKGVNIVRVHDAVETVDAIKVINNISQVD